MMTERYFRVFGVRVSTGPSVTGRGMYYVLTTDWTRGEQSSLLLAFGKGHAALALDIGLATLAREFPRVFGYLPDSLTDRMSILTGTLPPVPRTPLALTAGNS